MRGLKKTAPDGAEPQNNRTTHVHGDSMTESAQWWGGFSGGKNKTNRHTTQV